MNVLGRAKENSGMFWVSADPIFHCLLSFSQQHLFLIPVALSQMLISLAVCPFYPNLTGYFKIRWALIIYFLGDIHYFPSGQEDLKTTHILGHRKQGWDLLRKMKYNGSVKRFLRCYSHKDFMVCQLMDWLCMTSEPELVAQIQSSIGG